MPSARSEARDPKSPTGPPHGQNSTCVSPAKANVGDKVLVKGAVSTLHGDGLHTKLVHDRLTGQWEGANVIRQGLSFIVRLNGRQIRERSVSASDKCIPTFGRRSCRARPKISTLTWSGQHSGFADTSVVAVPLYTLTNMPVVQGVGGSPTAWRVRLPREVSGWHLISMAHRECSTRQLPFAPFGRGSRYVWEAYHGPNIAA